MRKYSRTAYNKMKDRGLDKMCFPNCFIRNHRQKIEYTDDFLKYITQKYPTKSLLTKYDERIIRYLYNHNRIDEFYHEE